jgi:iron(III) transport system ATP-binding protein
MLRVEGLYTEYPNDRGEIVKAAQDVTFTVPEGKLFTLLGPSGCGKTTTLRSIAGLEKPRVGEIAVNDRVVYSSSKGVFVTPNRRGFGMVFQSYAIWPHMSVFENAAFPLQVGEKRYARAELREKVMRVLTATQLDHLADREATKLSGGQQQRLALARALVMEPALLLLDEPLSNLDARLREAMRDELVEMIARVGITALYVTHDQAEAFVLARWMAVMDRGRIVQEGAPRDLYARPGTPFIAGFLGAANLLRGKAERHGDRLQIALAGANGQCLALNGDAGRPEGAVEVMIRPEDIDLIARAPPGRQNVLNGRITHIHFMGSQVECGVDLGGTRVRAFAKPSDPVAEGQPVSLRIDPARCTVFPASAPT